MSAEPLSRPETWEAGDQVARLRDALAEFAKDPDSTPGPSFSPDNCKHVLSRAAIDVTPEQFDRATVVFRQMPFYGGNYTSDARRLLKVIDDPSREDS